MTGINSLRTFREPISSLDLARFLECEHVGDNVDLNCVSDLATAGAGTLFFQSSFSADIKIHGGVSVVPVGAREQIPAGYTYILSKNPKLDFTRVVQHFLSAGFWPESSIGSYIHPTAELGENVYVGPGAVIEAGVVISDGSYIGANAVVKRAVQIGKGCMVSNGAIVGNDGLTIQRDEMGNTLPLRHVGDLIIGDNVEIGPNATIGRSTLGVARIEDGVILGPQVNVGHNGYIEKNVIVTGCASISGGVRIGMESWLGTNCSIIQKITIGKKCTIGLGACVTRDVPDGQTVSGFPAMTIRQLQTARRSFERK